jgi:hypothetical protein
MNFIFFAEGITASIIPILTLIEHKSEHIVGCVLIGQDQDGELPSWFVDSAEAENPAAELLEHVDREKILMTMDVFLVVKEPNSFLQLSVLAVTNNCCNLNFSGEGGRAGEAVLKSLIKHNIRTYPSYVKRPKRELDDSHEQIKAAFIDSFVEVAENWLPACWGLDAVRY